MGGRDFTGPPRLRHFILYIIHIIFSGRSGSAAAPASRCQYSYCRDCFGFPDLVKKRRVGSPSVLVHANTSCSQESTHSHECAPFLSDQFAICACMCCVFSPPACAHHAVSYASLFPPPLPAFPPTIPPPPHCTGLLQGCACALRGEDTFYPFNLILLSCDAWIQGL
jgi:hypothetical protein